MPNNRAGPRIRDFCTACPEHPVTGERWGIQVTVLSDLTNADTAENWSKYTRSNLPKEVKSGS